MTKSRVIKKEFKIRKGTECLMKDESDRAIQETIEETDLRIVIKKYGIIPQKQIEPIYDINIGSKTPIAKRLEYAESIQNYFSELPADIRKEYRDDYRNLYIDIINQKFDKLEKLGIKPKEINKEEIKTKEIQKDDNKNKMEQNSGQSDSTQDGD